MRSQNLACDTCDIYFFSLNLCLEIDINTIEREVVYLSCLFISVFFFCLFQFLDSSSQKFTLSNFDQEVAFNQYLYLYQEFMFVVCFFVYLSACFWCLDYSRTNEQIFIKNL